MSAVAWVIFGVLLLPVVAALFSRGGRRGLVESICKPQYTSVDVFAVIAGYYAAKIFVGSYDDLGGWDCALWFGAFFVVELPLLLLGAWLQVRRWSVISRGYHKVLERLAQAAGAGGRR